jgi:hypothetical protein
MLSQKHNYLGDKKWKSEYLHIRVLSCYKLQLEEAATTSTMTIFAVSLYAPIVAIFYAWPLSLLINCPLIGN